MPRRLFSILAIASLLLSTLSSLLWVISLHRSDQFLWYGEDQIDGLSNPWRFVYSVCSEQSQFGINRSWETGPRRYHPLIWRDGGSGRFDFGSPDTSLPPICTWIGIGGTSFDSMGFCVVLWTTYVRWHVPVIVFLLLPTLWSFNATHKRHRQPSGLCPTCKYDLRATSNKCPECGTQIVETSNT
jgi:hypothetical protein